MFVQPKRSSQASAVAFHTAMTAFGDQHSLVIATAGGSVIKCNADAWVEASFACGVSANMDAVGSRSEAVSGGDIRLGAGAKIAGEGGDSKDEAQAGAIDNNH